MRSGGKFVRSRAIEEMRNRLWRTGWPRLEMSLILILSAAVGFLTSMLLLAIGVTAMTLRYPVAVVAAYGAFLLFLRVWLWWRSNGRVELPGIPDIGLDGVGLPDVDLPSGPAAPFAFGGGGDFGGGGATDTWGAVSSTAPSGSVLGGGGGSGGGGGGGFSLDVDLDDGLAIIAAVVAAALAACALAACLYVVWVAPIFLAEILVDALVVSGFYRGLKHARGEHWLRSALRGTWIPAVVVFVFLAIAGFILDVAFPEASSIGGVLQYFN